MKNIIQHYNDLVRSMHKRPAHTFWDYEGGCQCEECKKEAAATNATNNMEE